jgi:peptidoglycan/xylan/chitin deacetylase (PgdA/CDA1 family)
MSARDGSGDVAVLMYHAVLAPGEDGHAADAQYSISRERFARDIDAVLARGAAPCSVADAMAGRARRPPAGPAVAFTFDDGHASHLAAAAALAQRGARADFFVNPGLVGSRGLLDWGQLREMDAMGQSIQSHGWTHRHLDTLDEIQLHETLHRSKAVIEDRLGRAVTLFAPPGGRMVPDLVQRARAAGYEAVCSSRAGLWRPAPGLHEIRRLAVRRGTSPHSHAAWIRGDSVAVAREVLRERCLLAAKRLLGPGRYAAARRQLMSVLNGDPAGPGKEQR